ncbi:MAG: sialidase family protein, partial [bacterium]
MRKIFLLCVLLCISTKAKAEWEPDMRLTNDTAKSYTSYSNQRNIASEGEYIHIVWWDERNGNCDIFYKRSTDSGVTWETGLALTTDTGRSDCPSIAVSGGVVNVIWESNRDDKNIEIYFRRSTDYGVTWEPEIMLAKAILSSTKIQTSIALDSSNVHIVWCDKRDKQWEIYYKHSSDFGVTWGTDTCLTNTRYSFLPSISVSKGIVNIVWADYESTYEDIFSIRSSDGGITWSEVIHLTDANGNSTYPSISVSNSLAVVTWQDERNGGNPQIFYKISTDNGESWDEDQLLTDSSGYFAFANVSVSSSNIHIVWYDHKNREIFYKRTTNCGLSWEPDFKLTEVEESNDAIVHPFVSASGTAVYIVWPDNRNDTNSEIYFKRNPTGNAVGVEEEQNTEQQNFYPNPADDLIYFDIDKKQSG